MLLSSVAANTSNYDACHQTVPTCLFGGAVSAGSALKPTLHLSLYHTVDYCGRYPMMTRDSIGERQRGRCATSRVKSESQTVVTILFVLLHCEQKMRTFV